MKTLTSPQPRASLIALGVNRFETRSWAPPRYLIGQRIGFHAAQQMIDVGCIDRDIWQALGEHIDSPGDLPLGAVIATGIITAAYLCGNMNPGRMVYVEKSLASDDSPILIEADRFGDFSPGRWAWQLDEIEVFEKPISAVGRQGLWNWDPPSFRFPAPLVRHYPAPGVFPALAQE